MHTQRKNRWRIKNAADVIGFALAPISLVVLVALLLFVTIPQKASTCCACIAEEHNKTQLAQSECLLSESDDAEVIESDRLSPKSYEIQTELNREISTAIGESMSVFFESLSDKPRKRYARHCAGNLRAKLFDIKLITDKSLDKTASDSANRSWEEVSRLVNSANESSDALNYQLKMARPNWKKVKQLSQSAADTLMESSDPVQTVMDNK